MSLRSPIPPIPPDSFGKRLWRGVKFYMVVAVILIAWAASSLIIQPALVWSMDRVSAWVHSSTVQTYSASLLGTKLAIPCDAFEDLPEGCDGQPSPGDIEYGQMSVLYFYGKLPDLQGLTLSAREKNEVPSVGDDGVFYTLQKSFGHLPTGDEALELARTEMRTYGASTEHTTDKGIIRIDAAEGSGAKLGNFYAVYTRPDGVKVAAACFGDTCKVPQAPWRDGFAYGFTVNKDRADDLTEIDAAVRTRLDGYFAKTAGS